MRRIIFFIIGALLLSACGIAPWRTFSPGPMLNPDSRWWGKDSYASNGERIYFTATNERGERISYAGGPSFGGMMGSYLTCASCHGPDGRGGTHTMHMDVMDAPDIRYTALSGEDGGHEDGNHKDDGHAEEHSEYDLDDFRQAVVEGKHPDGESLSRDMPRWQMSDEDIGDLFEFLKSLP